MRLGRRLEPVMGGREIVQASAPDPRSPMRVHIRRLDGSRIESIETRGKHLLIHLENGLSLHSHMGMNGSWRIDDGRGFGRPDRTAWLLLDLDGARVAQFGGPTLRLVRGAELARDPRLGSLGPDILAPDFAPAVAAARLAAGPEQTGVAMLDQTRVCGIGNIFKSEACFEAGIDPWRPASSLRAAVEVADEPGRETSEAEMLLGVARRQMLDAVETGRRPGRIYRKAGRPCPRCRRTRIRSRGQGDDNRTTYWCPNCQK